MLWTGEPGLSYLTLFTSAILSGVMAAFIIMKLIDMYVRKASTPEFRKTAQTRDIIAKILLDPLFPVFVPTVSCVSLIECSAMRM